MELPYFYKQYEYQQALQGMTTDHKYRISTMQLVLWTGVAIMGLKFLAWYLTNSNAILGDAMESVVNVVAGGLALWSLTFAAKPRDANHPYGHGKIEFVSAGVEGGMISIAGIVMICKAVYNFFMPVTLSSLDLGIALSVLSGLANFLLARMLMSRGRRHHSAAMVAEGHHLLTDTWSSAALVAGLAIIYFTGLHWLDGVITILLGLYILFVGLKLIRESFFHLIDTADTRRIEHVIHLLDEHRRHAWIDIHNVRILQYGPVLHVDAHMTFPWYFTLEAAHDEVDRVSRLARTDLGQEVEFFIHADPCVASSCPVCLMDTCPVRQHPFTGRLPWTLSNATPDRKHQEGNAQNT